MHEISWGLREKIKPQISDQAYSRLPKFSVSKCVPIEPYGFYKLSLYKLPTVLYKNTNLCVSNPICMYVCRGSYCISLMINNAEHLFMHMLAIFISFLGKCLFRSFFPFFNCFLCCWWWCFFFVCLFWFGLFFATENYTTKY